MTEIDKILLLITELEFFDLTNELTQYAIELLIPNEILALAKHIGIEVTVDIENEIKNEIGHRDYYTVGDKEYKVLTDHDADADQYAYFENYYEELIEPNIPEYVIDYFNYDKWIADSLANSSRGDAIASYDGNEYYEVIYGVEYYIYRTN